MQLIPILLGLATTGVSIAGAANAGGGPSGPTAQQLEADAASNARASASQTATADRQAQVKAAVASIAQNLPGLQAETGGATSPEYNASVAGSQTGGPSSPDIWKQALQKWLGQGVATAGSGAPQPNAAESLAGPSNEILPSFLADLPQTSGSPGLVGGNA